MKRHVLSLVLLAAFAPVMPAQSAQNASVRKALTPHDFDQWRSIGGERLSDDGAWVAYSLIPQVGNGEVVVRSATGAAEFRHSRGYIGRPQTRAGSGRGPAFNAPVAQFFGSTFVAFTIEPTQDEVETARRQKKRPADQPKSSLGIMRLTDGNVTVVSRVKSFEPPKGAARHLVYLLHPADSSAARAGADSAGTGAVDQRGWLDRDHPGCGGGRGVPGDERRHGRQPEIGGARYPAGRRARQAGRDARDRRGAAHALSRSSAWRI
jgi:hypothetical protein